VLRIGFGDGACAITPEIHHDNGELAGKLLRDAVPADVRLGVAVQEHERSAGSADTCENFAGSRRETG
jgi:hypothetical protein